MNVILQGYGRMGHMLEKAINESGDMQVIGVVHPGLYESAIDVPGEVDAIIDFSYPGNVPGMIARARASRCALVVGTTNLSQAQSQAIRECGEFCPVILAANYSLGVAVMRRAAAMLAAQLMPAGFDCEITEKHHNQKADAPSGTAKALLEAIDPSCAYARVYGREGAAGPRGREIGIHAIRGGTAAGEHTVMFLGRDEEIEIKHTAASREIFVQGALRAARALTGAADGLYTMDDILDM